MELTFENWLSGDIELVESYHFEHRYQLEEIKKKEKSILNFPENEIVKINMEQKNLFDKSVENYNNLLKTDFINRYTSALEPEIVLQYEINFLINVLTSDLNWNYVSPNLYYNKIANSCMNNGYYINFCNYINQYIRKGVPINYSFVPSSNSHFFNSKTDIIPEVYAEALYKHLVYLKKYSSKINVTQLLLYGFKQQNEPHNPYKDIFNSGWSYVLFKMSEEILIFKKNTHNADYALIYFMLNHSKVNGLKENVKISMFCTFINNLNRNKNICISEKSFKRSTSLFNEHLLKYGLKRYLKIFHHSNEIDKIVSKIFH